MTQVRGRWLGAGAIAIAVLVLAALSVAGPAHATGYRQTYLQANLCGNACDNGTLAVITQLERSIRARAPFAVTLNELCENQFDRLRTDLGSYRATFDPTGPMCHNGFRYGNAILVRAVEVTLVGRWELPRPAGDEQRGLMCVGTQLDGAPALVVCVTHISNVPGNHLAQVAAVANVLSGLTAGRAVLLGGDFNSDPGDVALDRLYDKCYRSGTGVFQEAGGYGCASRDAPIAPTYPGHKFDYIFLSGAPWSGVTAQAADAVGGLSDHLALWVSATLGRPAGSIRV